jgi:hypothetical protein
MIKKTEPALHLPLKASDYLRRQVKVTPYPTEPVGWIIENAGAETVLFSTDYAHPRAAATPSHALKRRCTRSARRRKNNSAIAISPR